MIKTVKKTLLVAILATALGAQAATLPDGFGTDNRIQYFDYTADDVFIVNAKAGASTVIQLNSDERIEGEVSGLGMGDAEAWSLSVRGNNIFIKPSAMLPDTNMIIVTNKRTYLFDLKTTEIEKLTSYSVRFKYPDEQKIAEQKVSQELADKYAKQNDPGYFKSLADADYPIGKKPVPIRYEAGESPDAPDPSKVYVPMDINLLYWIKGEESIRPNNVWDDGKFTFLLFDNSGDLPVAYRTMPDGTDALVNSHIEDNILVVHGVYEGLVLRFGESVVEVFNQLKQTSDFNHLGTGRSTKPTARRDIGVSDLAN